MRLPSRAAGVWLAAAAMLMALAGATWVAFGPKDGASPQPPRYARPGAPAMRWFAGSVLLAGWDGGVSAPDGTAPLRQVVVRQLDIVAMRDGLRGTTRSAIVPRDTVAWVPVPVD